MNTGNRAGIYAIIIYLLVLAFIAITVYIDNI